MESYRLCVLALESRGSVVEEPLVSFWVSLLELAWLVFVLAIEVSAEYSRK